MVFRGLAVLLTANIVVCTWIRFPATWKAVAAGRLNLPAVRCEDQAALTFTADGAPEALKTAYEQYFKRHFRRFRTEDVGDGFRIIGEKGRWTRLAVTGVHSGVVILLAGALVGSLFGFDGHAYYTGLQVTRDPGIFLVYIGFGLLIGGCFVTFFLGHERVAVQVSRSSATCTVRVHGARHRPSIGFETRLEKITANLRDLMKEAI